MRRGTRIAAALGAVALAGLAAVGSAPEPGTASGRPAAAVAPAPPEFRLAYAATHRLTLAAAVPGAAPAGLPELADDAEADYDDYDADARGGALVWVGRRAPTGVAHVDGDIFLRAGAAPAARLTDEPATERHPALSPDGRLVAFTSDRGGSNDVWVIGADGAGPRRVTDHPGDDQWPTWSPDGRRLAFSSTRDDPAGDIYTVAADGGLPSRLTRDAGADTQPAWSPDGARLAFTTDRFGAPAVATVPAGGGPVARAVPAPWAGEQAAWSADGRRLAFVTRRFDPAGDVYAMAATGAAVRPVARDPEVAEWGPTWRGDRVAFTTVAASADTDLWSADRGGADLRNLTSRPGREDSQPTFAADGSRLAYVSYTAGGVEVIVAEPDGRNPRVLRSGTFGQYESPTLSPDGRLLAVVDRGAGPDGGAAAAAVVPPNRIRVLRVLDGAEVGHLPVPAHLVGTEHDAAWSPDGGAIAVSRTSAARDTRVLPEQVEQELPPGRSVTVPTTVRTAGDPDSDLDVLVRPAVDCADGLTAGVEPPERLVRGDRDVTSAFAVTITRRTAAPTPSESPSEVPSEVPSEAPSEVPSEVPPQSSFAVEPTDEPAAGSLLSCTVSYTNQLVQDLLVQPVAAGQPYVQLDDVTAPDGGADGARVEFAPRAFDGTGTPIADVACDRRPGSAFPVGATYVTCTATDGQGRTARDRAVVAVTDGIESTHRVWVARIASATGDEVTFGDQLDLGARLRAPCRPGRTAGYPAWSPDGRALAFSQREADEDTEGAAWSALCVVDADGRNARLLVAPGAGGEADGPGDDDTAAQPAWTPDGSRIAYHDNGAIRTVPVTGGETAGVETVGRGRYPVYQRLPDRDLHLSMSVGGPGYVGGDPVPLTLTVRNDSPRPARNVWLSVALPAGVGDPPSIDSRCDARATLCRLVDLDEGDQVAVTMAVPAGDAYRGPLPARLNATVEGAPPADRQTSADLLVVHPELTVDPPIGRPGFVPRVDGANFPPGATVRVTWSTGITAEPDLVRVRPDGTFAVSRLVMREERPGLRRVHAEVVDGSPFAPVDSSEEFIVLPRVLAPPQLEYRKDPHDPRHR